MKIIFMLDNNEYVEVAPEKLQIRQISEGLAALGTEVTVPVKDEEGKVKLGENGQPETQVGFRPFINYNVNLQIPKPAEAVAMPVVEASKPVVEAKKLPAAKKTKANKKAN
jgi:hypothetical protein